VVEHRERQRLQHHTIGKRAGDGQDRRSRKEQLALGISVDVAPELVGGQPGGGLLVHDPALGEEVHLGFAEPERPDRLDQAAGADDDPVPAARGQAAGEHLEHAPAVGGPVAERGRDHGQLIVIGEQRGAHPVVQPHATSLRGGQWVWMWAEEDRDLRNEDRGRSARGEIVR